MIYGLLRITNSPNPFAVLDDVFYNKNIRHFDTANCYGYSEHIFGEWTRSRGIARNEFSIICKGGHHSDAGNKIIHRVNLNDILYDLKESFSRLKITYADSFMFHRDDENVSPQQIYEISNHLLKSNLCKKIGVSNWSTRRIEEVNRISNIMDGTSIIEESQIFLNYIKLSYLPYSNVHIINYSDYIWYLNHPEHKIQIYSAVCFLQELNNSIHQNRIFRFLLEYVCSVTSESPQDIMYTLLSNCYRLNVECIQGSVSPNHILSQAKIDRIFSVIKEKIPNFIEFISCFLVSHPSPENSMMSFLMNGVVGPLPLEDDKDGEAVDCGSESSIQNSILEIAKWVLDNNFNDYWQMMHHHERNNAIKELCLNPTINDIITKYIGYECICYNTEFFLRQNNDHFQYTGNWHIDPYINLDDTYPHFTLQIGLTDNGANNSLSAILGSHLFDYQNSYNMIGNNGFAPIVNLDETKLEPDLVFNLLNKKGYVYLFSNYMTHGKGLMQNGDENVRLALTMRIISKKSRIYMGIPHGNSHISKDIFTLGTENAESDISLSKLVWSAVQESFRKRI